MAAPHFVYPSAGGHLGSPPTFGNCEWCCYKHSCESVCLTAFPSFESISRSGITGSYGNSIFNIFRNLVLFSIVAVQVYIPTRDKLESYMQNI